MRSASTSSQRSSIPSVRKRLSDGHVAARHHHARARVEQPLGQPAAHEPLRARDQHRLARSSARRPRAASCHRYAGARRDEDPHGREHVPAAPPRRLRAHLAVVGGASARARATRWACSPPDYRDPDPDPEHPGGPGRPARAALVLARPRVPRDLRTGSGCALERHNGARPRARDRRTLRPDVVCWWAMGGMSLSLIEQVRRAGLPAVGVVGDDWMLYGPKVDAWTRHGRRLGPLAPVLGAARRRSGHARPVRHHLAVQQRHHPARSRRGAGFELDRAEVAHPGIDTDAVPARARTTTGAGGCCTWAGSTSARASTPRSRRSPSCPTEATPDGARLRRRRATSPSCASCAAGWAWASASSSARARGTSCPAPTPRPTRCCSPCAGRSPGAWCRSRRWPWARRSWPPGPAGSGEYLRDGENALVVGRDAEAVRPGGAVRRLAGDPGLRRRLREGGLATAARYTERAYNEAIESALRRAVA